MAAVSELKVLLVEDMVTMRAHLKEILRELGFVKIEIANSVPQAKQIIEEQPFDFILCDWHMEPITGMELLKHVRRHPKLATMCFIFLTAEKTTENVMEAITMQVDDYLLKPVNAAQFEGKLMGVLKKRNLI
jgi:two-component system chemotaxis response regulator CheY